MSQLLQMLAARPVFPAGDVIVNGTFDTDTDWTKGVGWSIGGGVASCDGTQITGTILQSALPTVTGGLEYNSSFDMVSVSSGGVAINIGGSISEIFFITGTHFFTTNAIATAVDLVGTPDFVGSVDNFEAILAGNQMENFGGVKVVDGSTSPVFYKNGLPFDSSFTLAVDTLGAINPYHQGLPFTVNGRLAVGTSAVVRYGNGGAPFTAEGRLAMSEAGIDHFLAGVPYSADGKIKAVGTL